MGLLLLMERPVEGRLDVVLPAELRLADGREGVRGAEGLLLPEVPRLPYRPPVGREVVRPGGGINGGGTPGPPKTPRCVEDLPGGIPPGGMPPVKPLFLLLMRTVGPAPKPGPGPGPGRGVPADL